MESREGINLVIKRAKPKTAGPSSIPGPKTQEEVALKKSEKKTKSKKPVDKPESCPNKLLPQSTRATNNQPPLWIPRTETSNRVPLQKTNKRPS